MSKKILGSLIVAATLLSGGMAFAAETAKIIPAVKIIQSQTNCSWDHFPTVITTVANPQLIAKAKKLSDTQVADLNIKQRPLLCSVTADQFGKKYIHFQLTSADGSKYAATSLEVASDGTSRIVGTNVKNGNAVERFSDFKR